MTRSILARLIIANAHNPTIRLALLDALYAIRIASFGVKP